LGDTPCAAFARLGLRRVNSLRELGVEHGKQVEADSIDATQVVG
jgi:hypothetical protein